MRQEQREARLSVMLSQICTAHYPSRTRFLSRTTLPQRGHCWVFLARFTPQGGFYYLSTSESIRPSWKKTKAAFQFYDSTGLSMTAWPVVPLGSSGLSSLISARRPMKSPPRGASDAETHCDRIPSRVSQEVRRLDNRKE